MAFWHYLHADKYRLQYLFILWKLFCLFTLSSIIRRCQGRDNWNFPYQWKDVCSTVLNCVSKAFVKTLFLPLPWQHQSWTDDLPLCQMCGVGTAPNCVYGPDGKGTQSHTNEDGHLRFRWETGILGFCVLLRDTSAGETLINTGL